MTKITNEVDKHIGEKIRSLRISSGLSRAQLAKEIDVAHQQLYKYEKGTNRVSASRLALIAKALSKNVSYFYKTLSDDNEAMVTQHQRMCLEISRNFMKIKDANYQNAVNILVKALASPSS